MQRALRIILATGQRGCFQEQHIAGINVCLSQMSDLQQLAASAAALGGTSSSNTSSSSLACQGQSFNIVRCMAGRTHKLSLKKENNRASRLAVASFLKQQPQDEQQQQQLSPAIATAIPPLPVLEEPPQHTRIGRITGPYSVGAQPCFAVMESGGVQWKVTADDVIYHNKIKGVTVNDVLQFDKVLLLGTQSETTIGRPFVPGASVVAAVEETFKDAKVFVFKKKKRKRYSKLQGHRSHITALRILEVRQPQAQEADNDAAAATRALANVATIGSSTASSIAFQPASLSVSAPQRRAGSGAPQQQQQQQGAAAPAKSAATAAAAGVHDQAGAVSSEAAGALHNAAVPPHEHTDVDRAHGPAAVVNAAGTPHRLPPRSSSQAQRSAHS